MFSWIQLRLIAPIALVVLLLVLGVGAARGDTLQGVGTVGAVIALGFWIAGIRSHDRAVRELQAAANKVADGGRVRVFEVEERPDELGELARLMRRASLELERRAQDREVERDELRTILTSLEDGLVAVDADLKVLMWSPQATALLGVKSAPEVGAPLVDAVAHGEMLKLVRTTLQLRRAQHSQAPLYGGSKGDRRISVSVHPMVGTTPGAVLLLRDVTELTALHRARREFAANVSHELRTPLSLVRGFVETLQDGALHDEERGPRFLGIVHRHVLALETLVADLLTLLTLEGRTERRPRGLVAPGPAVHEVLDAFDDRAATKGLALVREVPDDLPEVLARRDLFDRAVRNLVDNALKYTESGSVTVTVRSVDDGQRVEIAVKDTGMGIPPVDLPHVFRRFYRVDKSRSRDRGGTGLGLAIVKHIMHLQKGEVTCESGVDAGTTFTLRFNTPDADAERERASADDVVTAVEFDSRS